MPDVTLIRAVFFRQAVIGFAVNQGHHADIGGKVVGSMPATAMRLEDEGLVLEPQKMMDRGRERRTVLEKFRRETSNPLERLGDLRAQVAANELGARRLVELVQRIGVTRLRQSVDELLDYGERRVWGGHRGPPPGDFGRGGVLPTGSPWGPGGNRNHAEVTIRGALGAG